MATLSSKSPPRSRQHPCLSPLTLHRRPTTGAFRRQRRHDHLGSRRLVDTAVHRDDNYSYDRHCHASAARYHSKFPRNTAALHSDLRTSTISRASVTKVAVSVALHRGRHGPARHSTYVCAACDNDAARYRRSGPDASDDVFKRHRPRRRSGDFSAVPHSRGGCSGHAVWLERGHTCGGPGVVGLRGPERSGMGIKLLGLTLALDVSLTLRITFP